MVEPLSHCPAFKAADLLGDKWTLLIIRTLMLGATRYSEFSMAIPRISPSVLSARLKAMCEDGLVIKRGGAGQQARYNLTPSGREAEPIIAMLAVWGLKWAQRNMRVGRIDVGSVMWDFHKTLDVSELPDGETVLAINLTDLDTHNRWWVVASRRDVDLCNIDPGKEVDLYIHASLETLVELWAGNRSVEDAMGAGELTLAGEPSIADTAPLWFPISPVAKAQKQGINPAAMPMATVVEA